MQSGDTWQRRISVFAAHLEHEIVFFAPFLLLTLGLVMSYIFFTVNKSYWKLFGVGIWNFWIFVIGTVALRSRFLCLNWFSTQFCNIFAFQMSFRFLRLFSWNSYTNNFFSYHTMYVYVYTYIYLCTHNLCMHQYISFNLHFIPKFI